MENFLDRHSVISLKREFEFPLIKNPKNEIIPALFAATPFIIDMLKNGQFEWRTAVFGAVAAADVSMAKALIRFCINEKPSLAYPLHNKLGFRADNFLLITGFKKNKSREMITPSFDKISNVPWAKAEVDPNDLEIAQILASKMGNKKILKELYSKEDLEKRQDEFMTKVFKTNTDMLVVGGPIPIDALYDLMIDKVLPCNYELINPQSFSSEDTKVPDKVFPKYEILVKGNEQPLVPIWNKLNWGLITCCEKSILFGEGQGLVINVSGCNWFGTWGTGIFLSKPDNVSLLGNMVASKIGKVKNFQAVVEVPIEPTTKRPFRDAIRLRDDMIYKIT